MYATITTKTKKKPILFTVTLTQKATVEVMATSAEEVKALMFEADFDTLDWTAVDMTIEGVDEDGLKHYD